MKIEQDKIIIDLKPYSKNTIKEFAQDWLSNLSYIYKQTGDYFEHHWTNAEQLTKNHKYCSSIEVYQTTVREYMHRNNKIVKDAISELSKQLSV